MNARQAEARAKIVAGFWVEMMLAGQEVDTTRDDAYDWPGRPALTESDRRRVHAALQRLASRIRAGGYRQEKNASGPAPGVRG